MAHEIQEKENGKEWVTIATATTSYNADAICLAMSTKWPMMKYRVI